MERTNPATGQDLDPIPEHDAKQVEARLERAAETFPSWRRRPMAERASLLEAAADRLREDKRDHAELMTREMGKPVAAAEGEVEKCAWVLDHYAERAGEYLQERTVGVDPPAEARVVHEPLGPVLAVMPWNFPYWQVLRFAAPALAAGNVGLLKHASNVPGCAQAIEDLFVEAGLPQGAFQSLLVGSRRVDEIIGDDRVKAVTLTGSTPAGRAVASKAGEELKKTVLELGGSDPFVVLDDADVERAARVGARSRCINSGQSCIAAKRFVVHEDVYEEFLDAFTAEMEVLTVGDPTDPETDVGPQAREDLMADLHDQVQRTVEDGGDLRLGGQPLDREGFFYPPTVIADVPRDAAGMREEVFGPAASVHRVEDAREAVEVANDSPFGLGASIWTEDLGRGEAVARGVEAGCVFVNELVKSDPRLPFGGVKRSGYGRELSGDGIREFVNRKTVWVQPSGGE